MPAGEFKFGSRCDAPDYAFQPPIVSRELAAVYETIVERLGKLRVEAEEKLTKEQFIEAVAQAVACGDFMKHVTVGAGGVVDGAYSYSHKQAITYIPYRECEHLKARIRELEMEVDQLRRDLAPLEE